MNPQRQLVSRPTRHRCTVLLRSWSGGLEFARGVVTEAAQYECSTVVPLTTPLEFATTQSSDIFLWHYSPWPENLSFLVLLANSVKKHTESSTDDLKRGSVRLHDVAPRYLVDLAASADGRHQSRSAVPGALLHGAVYWPAQSRNDYPQLFNRQNLHSLRSSASWRPTYLFQH